MKKAIIKKYKVYLEICKRYSTRGGLTNVHNLWEKRASHNEYILNLLETETLDHKSFMKLDYRDKWDTYKYFEGKVTWLCPCGVETGDPESVFDGSLVCDNCNFELTRRTGGGQNNPFNWTFKYNVKELRKLKLKQL